MKLDYSNINKPKDDFNLTVKIISQYLKHKELQDWQPREYINDMVKWQSMVCQKQEVDAEPLVVLDSRYDIKLIKFYWNTY
ncbi:MAG: hypothetical protein L0G93_18400 [Acinetobacter sp.]|nr:hypothetical protein [Acinetobacter sp.]